jgi:hypothetical protein
LQIKALKQKSKERKKDSEIGKKLYKTTNLKVQIVFLSVCQGNNMKEGKKERKKERKKESKCCSY